MILKSRTVFTQDGVIPAQDWPIPMQEMPETHMVFAIAGLNFGVATRKSRHYM
jgi:hypothetical protein